MVHSSRLWLSGMDFGVAGTVISLALIDSFDPCIFAIYSTLLISASMTSIKRALSVGLAFIVSAYIGYFLFGILLRYATLSLPRYILAIVTVTYGIVMLLHTVMTGRIAGNENVCREDELVCRIGRMLRLDTLIDRGTVIIFLIGFVAAFTLFPCTAGMYVVFNLLTVGLNFIEWIPLALLYVAVFVLPLILILLSFVGITRFSAVHTVLIKHQKYVKLLGSVLLIAVSLYILLTSVSTAF